MDTYKSSTVIETGEKVVLVGDSAVGKTSILKRYVDNSFETDFQTTIGFEQYNKTETIDGEQIKLALWDTAGQERFRSLSNIFFKSAKCIVFVFDLTNKDSFNKFDYHHQQIVQFVTDETPIVIMGNKCDLADKIVVKEEEVQQLVQKYKYFYIKTSAKDNIGVNEAFRQIAKIVKEQLQQGGPKDDALSQDTKNIAREPLQETSRFPCCPKSSN